MEYLFIFIIEVCEYLYEHFVLKLKVKDEDIPSSSLSNSLELQAMINRPKQTILQSVTLPSTPPPIMVTATQGKFLDGF